MRWQGLAGTAAAVCLAFTLAACTASPPPDVDAPTPQPSPTAAGPTPAITSDVLASGDSGPCAAAVPAHPVADATEVAQLGGATLAVPYDRGSMPYAAGEAILNDQGDPVAYKVAANDVISAVGARFCVGEQWLYWVNYVRRDGDTLFAGDTLNLDAHTILSVGDQNGVVHSNPLPEGFVIPPQR